VNTTSPKRLEVRIVFHSVGVHLKKPHFFLDRVVAHLYNVRMSENNSPSDYSPTENGEIQDVPDCSNCADTGVIQQGYNVNSTSFCECGTGVDTFEAWADAESDASELGSYACDRDWDDSPSGGDYWRNEDGEYCCG